MTEIQAVPRPELGKMTVGQKVMVRSGYVLIERPPIFLAVVTKVGRVWVEMEEAIAAGRPGRRWRMRKDTQNTGGRTYDDTFATLEQHDWDVMRDRARKKLMEQGLRLERGSRWVGREVELASLILGSEGTL